MKADMVQLIEPLIPALRRYARSFLKNSAAADDLVQDTLERAISRWHLHRPDGDTKTWLFTILHNLAVNALRRSARRGTPLSLDAAAESDIGIPSTQEDALRQRDIMAAVDRLPDEQRSVLLLVSVEDLSYADAARVLGVPIGTVMSRLNRARTKLLSMMEDEGTALPDRTYLRRVQ